MQDFPPTDRDFEQALRFLCEKMPDANDLPKPTLLHSTRVGVYLYNRGYDSSISIAGLLHDVVEDADVTIEEIENKFGKEVSVLVQANTKDESLTGDEKYRELLTQCVNVSEAAAIVKVADIMDNLIIYRRYSIDEGVKNMMNFGKILLEIKPERYNDNIFEELKKLLEI